LQGIQKTLHNLEGRENTANTTLEQIDGKTRTAIKEVRATCTKLTKQYQDLQTHYQTLQQGADDNADNENALIVNEQHHNRLDDIESLALTANMANSIANGIQTFHGYDSHDPRLWFTKLHAGGNMVSRDKWVPI
jgi:hypothetical protein